MRRPYVPVAEADGAPHFFLKVSLRGINFSETDYAGKVIFFLTKGDRVC